jgi:hypothetical protein
MYFDIQCSTNVELSVLQQNQLTLSVEGWKWIWPQFNIGIYNVDIYKQQYNRKYKNITVGTQVMTINTMARMATADYGNQKYLMYFDIQCSTNVELSVLQQNQLTLLVEGWKLVDIKLRRWMASKTQYQELSSIMNAKIQNYLHK